MRRVAVSVLGLIPVVGAVMVSAAACASGSAAESRDQLTRVRITIGKTVLTAQLRDNGAARSLVAQLPLRLSFHDYNGQEKEAKVPRALSMRGMPRSADPQPGEIGYFGPTRMLVFYTSDVGRFDGIARIGRFDGSVAAIKSRTDFIARIELAR
jgi:hypothetical protein